ncbi:nucleoid-associated protein [Selenomonas ruminantium]|uniref:nucleoid-associated protein n=1 Tax=Selenomonas ruminantium TaxID=971 RepID=UPI00040C8D94|nr:nucleoid-associated protein [Selenomonas ruminantium]
MVIIDKAILHILDFNSGMTVYSDEELTVQDSIETFLLKHIEKSWGSQDAKPGTFYDDSHCAQLVKEYLGGEMSFVPFSKELAKKLEDAFVHAEEMASSDVIVADVRIDDRRQIVIFKSNSHIGYTHQVNQTEAGIKNEIINHYSIMPNLSQKMEEFAFIDTESKEISVTAKKYTIDGNSILVFPEILLECSLTPSPKEAIKNLSKTAAKVAEAYGQDKVATEAAVKSYVTENMQNTDELDLVEAGKEIFKENPSMQADFDNAIKEAGFTEPVKMDQEATIKKMCKHKLKTDTGIELTIPSEYFDNTEFMEFHNNEDGTLSIMLKHIGNIVNRG